MKIAITTTTGVQIMTVLVPDKVGECIEKWKAANKDIYISHREIQADEALPDRKFRDTWEDKGGKIVANPDKPARAVPPSASDIIAVLVKKGLAAESDFKKKAQ